MRSKFLMAASATFMAESILPMFPSTRIRSDEAGNDVIQGDSGNDQILGGSGNDILTEERTTELAVN
jgi:hypothetical protein